MQPVRFVIEDPCLIPAARYHDADFFAAEAGQLWPRVWQMACRLEEIPDVGDWTEYRILDQSILVVRTQAGVRAFHNVCRHRGMRLASGGGNCRVRGFICPFHGWRWTMDGRNSFVFSREIFDQALLTPEEIDLTPCRVELWGGCAFVNLDGDAPPLLECLGPTAAVLDARNVSAMRVEWWRSTVLPVNWKLAMEAFMEGYHVMRTHPQLHAVAVPGHDAYGQDHGKSQAVRRDLTAREMIDTTLEHFRLLGEGMAGMISDGDVAIAREVADSELPDDPRAAMGEWMRRTNAEITRRGRARGVPVPDLNELAASQRYSPVEYLFPNYFLLPFFGNMAAYRIRPLTPETCLFELWSLTLGEEGGERPRPVAPVPVPHDDPSFPEIPRQDYANLPLQQLGLHARGFEHMRLSGKVEGLISNYQRLIDGFLQGTEWNRLAPAMQAVCGPYEASIRDLGF